MTLSLNKLLQYRKKALIFIQSIMSTYRERDQKIKKGGQDSKKRE